MPPACPCLHARRRATALAAQGKVNSVPSVVSITSGLKPGDRVVINGLTKARPGSPVAPELWELKSPSVTEESK